MAGLSAAARTALAEAEIVTGATRHLALAGELRGAVEAWPVPFEDGIARLIAHRGRRVVMLASGDPFWFGAGGSVAAQLPPAEWVARPVAGSFSLLAARLGWRLEEVVCLGLHAAPFERLRPVLAPGVRVLCTLRDGPAVGALSGWLARFGAGGLWRAATPAVADLDRWLDFLQGRRAGADRHTTQVYLFDRRGRLALRSVDLPPAAEVVRLMTELAARPA